MSYQAKRPPLEPCPVEEVVGIIAGKWKARILYLLSVETHTFAGLKRGLNGVKQQVLAAQLKALIRDGIVSQDRVAEGKTGFSRYSLTDEGAKLIPVLNTISEWGQSRLLHRGISWTPPIARGKAAGG